MSGAEQVERVDDTFRPGGEPSLKVFLRHVWSHLGLIVSICFAVVVVALFMTLTTRPEYEGRVRLLLESSAPKVVDVKRVVEPQLETEVYLQTQMEIIRNRALARKVISSSKLETHKEFQPAPKDFWDWYQDGYLRLRGAVQSWIQDFFGPGEASSPEAPEDKQEALVRQFLARIHVTPVRGTRLLEITFRGFYPDSAAWLANVVADAFIEFTLEQDFASTRRASKWLEGQLAELKEAIERSERALHAYRQQENLVGVKVAESPEVVSGALGTLSQEIMKARSERITAETAYRRFKSSLERDGADGQLEMIPAGLLGGDTLINNLQINLADAQREYADLSRRYKERHPAIVQLGSKITFLKDRLRREISQAVKKQEVRFIVAAQRERSLMESLDKEKARVIRLGGKMVQLGILEREAESNRKLYELFLTRMKETSLATNLTMTNIRVLDQAAVPQGPVRPNKRKNLFLAVLLGLSLGVVAALGVEYFDTSLRDPADAERQLGIPVMATVDHLGRAARQSGGLVVRGSGRAGGADFFDTLRTNLLYAVPAEGRQSLLVTSATPEEGKTFISTNLAANLAGLGEEVVLVDGDLRRSRAHQVFAQKGKEPGLTDFLVGRCTLEEVLRPTGEEHLSLIPAGHYSPSPADLLSSAHVDELFKELRARFRYIIVDSAPVLSVPDSLSLVSRVDGVLVVAWAGHTSRRYVSRGIKLLKGVQGSRVFFGLVMNRIAHRRGSDYYYYHKKYGYYYSDSAKS